MKCAFVLAVLRTGRVMLRTVEHRAALLAQGAVQTALRLVERLRNAREFFFHQHIDRTAFLGQRLARVVLVLEGFEMAVDAVEGIGRRGVESLDFRGQQNRRQLGRLH